MNLLITGGAGFIGSNLAEYLLENRLVNRLVAFDNLSNGSLKNLKRCLEFSNFEFINGDIRDFELLKKTFKGVDIVSHQAALGSVPRSISDPITTNEVNIEGTLNVLKACVDQKVKRVILAGSSSTYGSSTELPKVEEKIGQPLSPYAVTKYTLELYADVFKRVYDLDFIVLRYFNVFGPKQDPENPYAAVVPLFCKAVLKGDSIKIFGDGEQFRDFTFISNVVEANESAIFTENKDALNQVYNVACGEKISINQLADFLIDYSGIKVEIEHLPERVGDIKNSLASIEKAKKLLDYEPKVKVLEGVSKTFDYYRELFAS
ncbi:MAG: NAD-dependent epimerase/dehydratase family protein [Cytophagales bacterium]